MLWGAFAMWSLKIVKGAELADRLVPEIRLPQPLQRLTIGRDPAAGWPIEDRTLAISGRHCEVVATAAGPALRDLSTNGTFVNGASTRLLGEHLLRDGDRFELGPFTIGVTGTPLPEPTFAATLMSALTPTLAAPVRSHVAVDSTPARGGDPAAMAAHANATGAPGLTEILRVAAPSQDSDLDLTKIRLAPSPPPTPPLAPGTAGAAGAAGVAAGSAAAPAASAPVAVSTSAAAVPAAALRQALARGLGLPVSALDGHDTLVLVQQLALTARAATAAVRQVMECQAQSGRTLSTLSTLSPGAAPVPDDNPLRTASRVDAAVLALQVAASDPVAVMQRSANELCAHEARLLQALIQARNHPPR